MHPERSSVRLFDRIQGRSTADDGLLDYGYHPGVLGGQGVENMSGMDVVDAVVQRAADCVVQDGAAAGRNGT